MSRFGALLLRPVKRLMTLCRHPRHATTAELQEHKRSVGLTLSDLQYLVETGQISQKEYEARESEILDLLEEIREILRSLDA